MVSLIRYEDKAVAKLRSDIKLFIRYGSVYLGVFLLFILLFLPIYAKVYTMAKTSVLEESARKLHEGVLQLDNRLDKMTELANIVQDNEAYIKLSRVTGQPQIRDYYSVSKLEKDLLAISSYQTLPMKFFLLFHKNPVMVSGGIATTRYGDFYGKLLTYEGMNGEDFYEAFFDMDSRTKLIAEHDIRYMDGRSYTGATFLVKMPVQGFLDFKGVMAFLLDKEELFRLFVPEDIAQDSFLCIVNKKDNTPVIQAGCIRDTGILPGGSRLTEFTAQGETYTVLSEDTEDTNLAVIIGIRQKAFRRNVSAVTKLVTWYLGLALLLFLAGCIWFALRRTKSVAELIKTMHFAEEVQWKAGDYGFIRQAFTEIMRKADRYEKEVQEMKGILDNTVLEKMFLYGIYSEKEKMQVQSLLAQTVEFYCVVSINWEFDAKAAADQMTAAQNILYQTDCYLGENFGDNIVCVSSGMREIILLIPLKPKEESYTSRIGLLFERLGRSLQEEFGVTVYCGISDISMDLYNVRLSYLQAKAAARQSFEEGLVKEFDALKNNSYVIDFHLGAQLYELTVSGEQQGIGILFDKLRRQLRYEQLESEEDIKHLFYMLRDAMNRAQKDLQQENMVLLPVYDRSDNIRSLLEKLSSTAQVICACFTEKKKSKNPELKKRIIEFIETHFYDPDLGALEIADGCGISEKYLYQFVKEQTGKTVGDYIEGLRMGECERLMLETDKSINEICVRSGFRSVNTFYKAFKRIYGVAPGKWRENRGK